MSVASTTKQMGHLQRGTRQNITLSVDLPSWNLMSLMIGRYRCLDQLTGADITLMVYMAVIHGKLAKKGYPWQVSSREERSITLDTKVNRGAREYHCKAAHIGECVYTIPYMNGRYSVAIQYWSKVLIKDGEYEGELGVNYRFYKFLYFIMNSH